MIVGTMPKQVEYVLMVLAEMQAANPGHLFSARSLCEHHQVPFDVMSKVMQRLCRVGILQSIQGKQGGYLIAKDLATVSLFDLMESVVGDVAIVKCLKSQGHCAREKNCLALTPMRVINLKLRELYQGLKVLDLITTNQTVRVIPN